MLVAYVVLCRKRKLGYVREGRTILLRETGAKAAGQSYHRSRDTDSRLSLAACHPIVEVELINAFVSMCFVWCGLAYNQIK